MKNLLLILAVLFTSVSFSQDVITKKTGEDITAKVLEVGANLCNPKK